MNNREKDIDCFYGLLRRLEERVGGKRKTREINVWLNLCRHSNLQILGLE